METIDQSMTPCTCRAPYARPSFNASQTQLAAVSDSRSLDLALVTEEGDKVTFSMDAKASAVYAAHGRVEGDDEGLAGQWSEFSAGQYEREVNFSVEGDLNADERREIRKVIKTVKRMMRNFVAGRLKPMMAKAGKLEGLETIDSLNVNMEYERQVVVARQTQAAVGYDRYGAARALPAQPTDTAPAAAQPARPSAAAPAEAVEAPAPRMSLETESKALSREMAREVKAAQAPFADVLASVDRLLKAFREMAGQWNPLGAPIVDHVRDLFHSALGETAAPEAFAVNEAEQEDD